MSLEASEYRRDKALAYAARWALDRNPAYYNFDKLGGDCTNFLSQCLYAGAGVMNHKKVTGWYYYSLNNRAAAWSSVQYFHQFLTTNKGQGPYGHECGADEIEEGDYVQLATMHPYFHHSGIITRKDSDVDLNKIYIACHTYDFYNRPLGTYTIRKIRFIKIDGVRS